MVMALLTKTQYAALGCNVTAIIVLVPKEEVTLILNVKEEKEKKICARKKRVSQKPFSIDI